jgi:branched-subunit amino acid aminotransferase/4-amino-4-deoxychorismate lyase
MVSGLSPGLNYGQQCYEGLKAFRTIDGRIIIFRPQFHAARMRRSAESVLLCPPPEEVFLECIRRAVVENAEYVPPYESNAFMYIRPVLFGASTGLWGVCDESILAVFVHPTKPQRAEGAVSAVVCDEFDRSAPRGMGSFKVGGNYAPVCNPRDTHLKPFSLIILMRLSSLAYLAVVDRFGDTWGRQQRWGTVLCYILIAQHIPWLKNSQQVVSLVTG